MSEKEKKTEEAKKPYEAKDTIAETTAEDTVIEKAIVEEKKGISSETKIALGALISLLLSLLYLWMLGTRDKISEPPAFIGFILVSTIVGALFSLIIARFAAWNKNQGIFLLTPLIILWCIFLLPPLIGITPLYKYHNYKQLERDKKIVEILEITVLKDQIEVRLPSKHASENSYLRKTFSLDLANKGGSWKNTVIPCREGDKYWYKVNLPFPNWYKLKLAGHTASWTVNQEEENKYKSNTDNIVLFFDHAFADYQTTKEITFPEPDPNSL